MKVNISGNFPIVISRIIMIKSRHRVSSLNGITLIKLLRELFLIYSMKDMKIYHVIKYKRKFYSYCIAPLSRPSFNNILFIVNEFGLIFAKVRLFS